MIVWDEATMAHKKSLEALNITLQDLKSKNEVMGGITVLLAGDFRQTLPIVKNGGPADELDACLKSSHLWSGVERLSLTINMRIRLQENSDSNQLFNDTLMRIGNGLNSDGAKSDEILLSTELCQGVSSLDELISKVFPDIQQNLMDDQWLRERAILAPKNDSVNQFNHNIQNKIFGVSKTYYSVDSVVETNQTVKYPTEFLNSIEITGLPSHMLTLKIGVPIMLLRNVNPPKLCNGKGLKTCTLIQLKQPF